MSDPNLINRVAESLFPALQDAVETAVDHVSSYCESPIEVMLLAAFGVALHLVNFKKQPLEFIVARHDQLLETNPGRATFVVVPQYRIDNYRIDFAVYFGKDLTRPLVFVECDGHNYHERTKEQAAHDRSKDRFLQSTGTPILRFTGSEIYRDAGSCVAQIISFVSLGMKSKRSKKEALVEA